MALVDRSASGPAAARQRPWWDLTRIPTPVFIVGIILVLMPVVANDFLLRQILSYAMILGTIALSLMFLAGYGNMVSLVQMTVAGVAAYMTAIFGTSAIETISLGWPWWVAAPLAILVATVFGTLSGALAVRTEGIYTIMITLAIAAAMFYLVRQNYTLFNGFSGLNQVRAPVFWGIDWRSPIPFYYLCLLISAAAFAAVVYVKRSPFGLALQGVRDNPRRMAALGFNVTAHRIAAYAFASVIAGTAGVLLVWLNGQVSPGTIGIGPAIDILIIAVVGGFMVYTLATRSLLDINVLHDRNPIAVKLSDGSIRNAYTMRVLNKHGFDRLIAIDIEGPANAMIHVVGADSVTPDRPMIVVGRDQTEELRLLVTAPADSNPDKSVPVKFHVTDIGLGVVASATDNFVNP